MQITFLFMWDNMCCSSGRSIAADSFDATEQHVLQLGCWYVIEQGLTGLQGPVFGLDLIIV